MKIISVRFQNIHSLKGNNYINFSESPFSDSGLFAITGPTGAGKSTILDTIILALYGKIPRNSETGRMKTHAIDVMTKFTKECFSEVVFEVKSKRYMSKWSARLGRKNITDKMELIDLQNEKIIEEKKSKVPAKVEEISGLNYDRFLRSVMLSQGEFASFLKAKESERGDLLEQITGTEIYSEISTTAHEKEKIEREKLSKLEQKKENIEILSIEQVKELENKKSEIMNLLNSEKENFQKILSSLKWIEEVQKLKKEIILKEEINNKLIIENESLNKKRALIDKNSEAEKFREILMKKDDLQKNINRLNNSIAVIKNGQIEQEKKLDLEKSRRTTITKNHERIIGEFSNLDVLFNKIFKLDLEITVLNDSLELSKNELVRLKEKYLENVKNQNEILSEITIYQKEDEKIGNWISANKYIEFIKENYSLIESKINDYFIDSKSITKLEKARIEAEISLKNISKKIDSLTIVNNENEKLIASNYKVKANKNQELEKMNSLYKEEELLIEIEYLNDRISILRLLKFLSENIIANQNKIKKDETKITKIEGEISSIKEKKIQLLQKDEFLKEIIEELKDRIKLEQKLTSLEQYRKELKPNSSCPLCGSKEHPLIDKYQQIDITATEEKFNKKEIEKDKINKEINSTKDYFSELKSNLAATLANKNSLQESVLKNINEFEKKSSIINFSIKVDNLETILKEINVCEKKQKRLNDLRKSINSLEKEIKKLDAIYQEINEINLKKKLELNNKKNEQIAIKLSLHNIEDELNRILNKNEITLNEIDKLLNKSEIRLIEKQEKSVFLSQIKKLIKEFYDSLQKKENLQKQIQKKKIERVSFTEIIKNVEESIENSKNKIITLESEKSKKQLERYELFGEQKIDIVKKKYSEKISQIEKSIKRKDEEISIIEKTIFAKNEIEKNKLLEVNELEKKILIIKSSIKNQIKNSDFKLEEEIKKALLSEKDLNSFTKEIFAIERKLSDVFAVLQNLKEKYTIEKEKEICGFSEEIMKEKREESELKTIEYQQIFSEILIKLQRDKDYKLRFKKLLAEIDSQKKEWSRWKILNDLIGSHDGSKFSKFAQGLTLANLVIQANKHLKNLNQRYLIRKNREKDLELEIIDLYQADTIRTIKSLSGGETFLVSLSLALGLSELAGNKTIIESLFIDEGFGSLDTETLDVALSALDNLQALGKTIGIISHVELLKERISTQIQVDKISGGISKLKIVS